MQINANNRYKTIFDRFKNNFYVNFSSELSLLYIYLIIDLCNFIDGHFFELRLRFFVTLTLYNFINGNI